MVLGADGAVIGDGMTRFFVGEEFSASCWSDWSDRQGTYAEYVAVSADPPLARVPDDGLDEVVAAALPAAGCTGLALSSSHLSRSATRQC